MLGRAANFVYKESMVVAPSNLVQSEPWQALRRQRERFEGLSLRDLFARDDRAAAMSAEAAGIFLDYSKNLADAETMRSLVDLAEARDLRRQVEAMFGGAAVNTSERRAALHTALRAPRGSTLLVDGRDVVGDVHAVLDQMASIAERVRAGKWLGATGRPVRNVVSIGIGGSDLGPAMACRALAAQAHAELCVRFVSNVDGADFTRATRDLEASETLFIVCSKSFSTIETLTNARTAREWVRAGIGGAEKRSATDIAKHFVAVSSETNRAVDFGIDPGHVLAMWDWVGGRYSFPSAVGLSLMIAIGAEAFGELLRGMRAMDEHFRSAPFAENLPVILALLGIWYNEFFAAQSIAILPYADELAGFCDYLQQLDMESNGKRVRSDGAAVDTQTAPIVWGQPGTNGQHAFFQLLHQGTKMVPCDFIGFLEPNHDLRAHHDLLVANMIAQSQALAFGKSEDEVRAGGVGEDLIAHRTFPGNRPSNTIVAERLTPHSLGALIALYEHKVFAQAAIWGINPFDQWGVELGKVLATRIAGELVEGGELTHDSSTNQLIERYRRSRT